MPLGKQFVLMASVAAMISGCAGSVIFGHVVGKDQSDSSVKDSSPDQRGAAAPVPPPDAAPEPASAPAPAPAHAPATPAPVPEPAPAPAAPAKPGTPAPVVTSSAVTPAAMQPPAAARAADRKFKAVSVVLTPAANLKASADPRFSRDELLAVITARLRARQLLADGGDTTSNPTLQVVIDDFADRPSSNAVVFGYALSSATLNGSIAATDASGLASRPSEIKANARLAASTDGKQAQPLESLYRRFADVAISRLTGVPVKEPEEQPPR